MDELACFMDWDLEAIVRGCSIEGPAITTTTMEDLHPNFSHHFGTSESEFQDDLLFSFPEFSETTRVLDELEELYKPFYPVLHTLSSRDIVTSPLPILKEPEFEEVKVLKPSQKVAPQDLQVPTAVSKPKRSKKSLNKRVVKEVTAEDIGICDEWAWRKYGQKPIKGSPYPRSYYRCSSSKGCLARKQVERNHLDPTVFMVTYTAEHNHPHPIRRNSLAGSSRKNNNPIISTTTTTTNCCDSNSSSSAATSDLSPMTPLAISNKKEEGLLDDGWLPSAEQLDEIMEFNQRQLHDDDDELHGNDYFMDGFAAT